MHVITLNCGHGNSAVVHRVENCSRKEYYYVVRA